MLSAAALVLSTIPFASPAQAAAGVSAGVRAEISALVKGGAEQVGPTTVQWRGGAVVYDLDPSHDAKLAAPAATVHGCPAGYFCFYNGANYAGRRVQYRDCYEQGLPANFTSNVSSWVHNRSTGIVQPYDALGDVMWTEHPNSSSSYVGDENNDIMIAFFCHT
jgi:hypothetical protein